MKPLGNLLKHVGLAQRMGRATRLNLGSAYEGGMLSQQDWADMIHTCRGCSWAPQCDEWLNRNEDVECAPATCLNRARFEELRRRSALA